jgi:hypothetical protein
MEVLPGAVRWLGQASESGAGLRVRAGYLSWRSHVWTDVDPDRTGILPFVWDANFGFERYVDYALDVPMYFVYRNGRYEDATQQRCTFREYLEGRLPIHPGGLTHPAPSAMIFPGCNTCLVSSELRCTILCSNKGTAHLPSQEDVSLSAACL